MAGQCLLRLRRRALRRQFDLGAGQADMTTMCSDPHRNRARPARHFNVKVTIIGIVSLSLSINFQRLQHAASASAISV